MTEKIDDWSSIIDFLDREPVNVLSTEIHDQNIILKQLLIENKALEEAMKPAFIDDIIKVFGNRKLQKDVRKSTKYLNWPLFYYLKNRAHGKVRAIMLPGVHYIYGLPGKGKSTLFFDIIEEIRVKTGHGAYINTLMELPRFDEKTGKYYTYHPNFVVEEFFGKLFNETTGKWKIMQLKKFSKKFKTIGFDELLSFLNHRQNNTGEYLEIFLALIKFLAQRRHRLMNRVYFLNQLEKTDVQLEGAVNYIHEVEVSLDISYDDWIETGEMEKHIKGWYIQTSIPGRGKKSKENKILIESYFRKKTADFTYFTSLVKNDEYENVPEHQIKGAFY